MAHRGHHVCWHGPVGPSARVAAAAACSTGSTRDANSVASPRSSGPRVWTGWRITHVRSPWAGALVEDFAGHGIAESGEDLGGSLPFALLGAQDDDGAGEYRQGPLR